MNDMTWNEFCGLYFETAKKYAETQLLKMRGKLGEFDAHVDVDYVIDSAVLEALQKTYASFDESRGAKITSFLHTIVHNEIVDELKKQTKEAGMQRDVDNMKSIVEGLSDGPTHDFSSEARAKLIPRLHMAIEKLSPAEQIILYNYLEDKSTYIDRSVAQLQVSENYVSVRRNRILEKLPKLMEMTREDYLRFLDNYEGPAFANANVAFSKNIGISNTAIHIRKQNPILPSLDIDKIAEMLLARCLEG